MERSKEYWAIKRNHFPPKVTWRIIKKCTLSTQPKENVICLSMKSLKSFHTKETSYRTKGLNSVYTKCRHSSMDDRKE